MSSGPFLDIQVAKGLTDRLDQYRFAIPKPS